MQVGQIAQSSGNADVVLGDNLGGEGGKEDTVKSAHLESLAFIAVRAILPFQILIFCPLAVDTWGQNRLHLLSHACAPTRADARAVRSCR